MFLLKNKYRLFLFLFVFASFLFSTPKKVWADWVKYNQNPILSGTSGGWDSSNALCPNVLFEDGIYKMWYTGRGSTSGWKIGLAISNNGIDNWQKSSTPIIDVGSDDGWEVDTAHPFVINDSGIYKMWYVSTGTVWISGPDRFRIRYATSLDGLNWNEQDWVLYGTSGEWDSGGLDRGLSVLKIENEYHMWYAGVNEGKMGTYAEQWRIGYAVSPDGLIWQKYPNPVVLPTESWEANSVSYPHVIYEDGVYYMWYAVTYLNLPKGIVYATSTDGIHWQKPADQNPALVIEDVEHTFDDTYIASPFVIKQGDLLKMWYDGFSSGRWQIGYAENELVVPTPTPEASQPVVILPGLGASWNHQAMMLDTPQLQSEWQMTPGVKVYDGLIETLENAGYQKGINLFVFNYDWRRPVSEISQEFKTYLENVVQPESNIGVDLIGHSLGGLVARAYFQDNPENPVDQLITLGSPHQGSAKAYYLWEGGDLKGAVDPWQRIGLGLFLYFRKPGPGFSSFKDTIRAFGPVLKDLLPTFAYLKEGGTPKPYDQMQETNDYLSSLNDNVSPDLLTHLNTLSGSIPQSTLRWLHVQPANWWQKVLGLWLDGRPTGVKEKDTGDQTVLTQSSQLGDHVVDLQGLEHSELVETEAGQSAIMALLGLTGTTISTVSTNFNYEPSLVFQLASPAELEVLGPNGQPVGFQLGELVVIPGAESGDYQVQLNGTGSGRYHFYIGQITGEEDFWSVVSGEINSGEQIDFAVHFDSDSPASQPVVDPSGQILADSAQAKLAELSGYLFDQSLPLNIKLANLWQINKLSLKIQRAKYYESLIQLYFLRWQFAFWHRQAKINEDQLIIVQNRINSVIIDVEQAYLSQAEGEYSSTELAKEINQAQGFFGWMAKRLQALAAQDKARPWQIETYLLAEEKLNLAKNSLSHETHVKALGARYLSLEGVSFFR